MLTYEVEILEPRAVTVLQELESEKLIKLEKVAENSSEKMPLRRGSMKGLVTYIADDFDAPLDDFEEYM